MPDLIREQDQKILEAYLNYLKKIKSGIKGIERYEVSQNIHSRNSIVSEFSGYKFSGTIRESTDYSSISESLTNILDREIHRLETIIELANRKILSDETELLKILYNAQTLGLRSNLDEVHNYFNRDDTTVAMAKILDGIVNSPQHKEMEKVHPTIIHGIEKQFVKFSDTYKGLKSETELALSLRDSISSAKTSNRSEQQALVREITKISQDGNIKDKKKAYVKAMIGFYAQVEKQTLFTSGRLVAKLKDIMIFQPKSVKLFGTQSDTATATPTPTELQAAARDYATMMTNLIEKKIDEIYKDGPYPTGVAEMKKIKKNPDLSAIEKLAAYTRIGSERLDNPDENRKDVTTQLYKYIEKGDEERLRYLADTSQHRLRY